MSHLINVSQTRIFGQHPALYKLFSYYFKEKFLLPLGVPLFEFGCSLTQKAKMCSSDHSHQQKQHTLRVRVLPHPKRRKAFE